MQSQSPQSGAMVRTVEYPWTIIVRHGSQSPQSGAMVRTKNSWHRQRTAPPVSIPSKRGNGSDSRPRSLEGDAAFVSIPSKRGNGSDSGRQSCCMLDSLVSIPSKRGNGSDSWRSWNTGTPWKSQSPQSGAMVRTYLPNDIIRMYNLSQSPQSGAMVRT